MTSHVTRAQWSAVEPKKVSRLDGAAGVAVHWNGPSMPLPDHAGCAHAVRGIQHFHMVDRAWADIAYSACVCPHGYVFECRGPRVRTAANGTDDANDRFYAIMYLGGEGDPFTDAGKQGIRDARAWLMAEGGAGSVVKPHSAFKSTNCPGDAIRAWLPELERPLPTPPSAPVAPPVHVTATLPVLGLAASGKPVRKLQGLLVAHGHTITVDGDFGPNTRAALVRHQDAHGLPADGRTWADTWRTLIEK